MPLIAALCPKIVGAVTITVGCWAFSFLNGAMFLGDVIGGINRLLPVKSGMTKDLVFGFLGRLIMGLIFFP
jgi:hypothetical protein